MLLENKLRSYQIQKGEQTNSFLLRLQVIRDQLTSVWSTPDPEFMVRTALNAVSKEWETFVQRILGRATLPNWEDMWAALRQEEIRGMTKAGSSGKEGRIEKEEEEDASLTSAGQQGNRKKDISKVKCFHCGALGHYASKCPKKKNKGEASDSKTAPARAKKEVEIDGNCAMGAHVPLEKRWGDIEL